MRPFVCYHPSRPDILDRPVFEGVIFRDGTVAVARIGAHRKPHVFHPDWAAVMRHEVNGHPDRVVIFLDGHPDTTPESAAPNG